MGTQLEIEGKGLRDNNFQSSMVILEQINYAAHDPPQKLYKLMVPLAYSSSDSTV